MLFWPRRKGSGWQKSWRHSVPSQQIRNKMREAQGNQDSLLQTGIVFTSKAGLKQAVQTAEIWKSQTDKVFAQCTTENDKATIIYETKFFNSLSKTGSLWSTVIMTLKQVFYQRSNFAILYLFLPNPSIQIQDQTRGVVLETKKKLVSYLAKCWHKRGNFPVICSIHICPCLHQQLDHVVVPTVGCQPQRGVSFLVANVDVCSSKSTNPEKWHESRWKSESKITKHQSTTGYRTLITKIQWQDMKNSEISQRTISEIFLSLKFAVSSAG